MSATDAQKLREAIERVRVANIGSCFREETCMVADAAEKHLATLPATKTVAVWHVEFCKNGVPLVAVRLTKADAECTARNSRDLGDKCVRITGPHSQEVPA